MIQIQHRRLPLTPKEFALLNVLVSSPGKTFTREELLRKVWGTVYVSLRTVDVHMSKLRNKLRTASDKVNLAETIWGIGYRLRDPSSVSQRS
jgi:DNA-binding response OmpR family regulator